MSSEGSCTLKKSWYLAYSAAHDSLQPPRALARTREKNVTFQGLLMLENGYIVPLSTKKVSILSSD